MTRRSLPERTVDAWVTSAIVARVPQARIWAPTQVPEDSNWDFGIGLGEGITFILEDKGTTPTKHSHVIEIDRDQLNKYCRITESDTGIPVYYVLPKPPWHGEPSGRKEIPDQAVCRLEPVEGGFEQWAFVIRCTDLRKALEGARRLSTSKLPLSNSWHLAEFLREAQRGGIGKHTRDEAVQLSKIITDDPARVDNYPLAGTKQRMRTGSPLAVLIPDTEGGR